MENKLDWKSKILFSPEDYTIFNSSRLLILFEILNDLGIKDGIDLERLCYYDFFASNPFLILEKNDPLRLELETEGFEPNKLEYLSTAQLYRTKRALIKQYLALLLSKGLIKFININGKIQYRGTPLGIGTSKRLDSLYAIAYRKSATLIIKLLKSYSDKKLWENATKWLESKSFQVDLYDLVDVK